MNNEEKRLLIDPKHGLSIEEQCDVLGLPRSSYYYEPILENAENLTLMKRIEELHYKYPEYGYRKVQVELRKESYIVNEKRVERLWRAMGFSSILPKPNLSKVNITHPKYPYLLNGMAILSPNQVFSTDITFIPTANGYIYLVSIMDWYSRYVLSWELSNSMNADFCLTALERALKIAVPEFFNTDQGSQFTSGAFIKLLESHLIKISMDGKGRCIDNIYQERGWWSLKYEYIYPNRLEKMSEIFEGIKKYYEHFNCRRPHQALMYATPYEIYHGVTPKYSRGKYLGFTVKKAGVKR